MTIRLYRYDQTGAPVLTGQTAKLNALIKACLVDGYNSGSVTSITRSGNTATVTRTGHGFVSGQFVLHAGADQTEYNVEEVVTVIDANTYTYPVSGTPATPATGTITSKFAGCGWAEEFTGTGKSAFRAGSGNRLRLRVDASGTNNPRVIGYESMTDVDTGTAAFPLEAQMAGGGYAYTSNSTDATARPWLILASETWVYIWIANAHATSAGFVTTGANTQFYFFGDFQSYKVGDAFNTAYIFAYSTGSAQCSMASLASSSLTTATNAHFIARSYLQTGSSVTACKSGDTAKGSATMGSGQVAFPDPVTGGLLLSPVYINEASTGVVRGVMPNLWQPLHGGLTPGDTFTGSGALAGKKFLILACPSNASSYRAALEVPHWW